MTMTLMLTKAMMAMMIRIIVMIIKNIGTIIMLIFTACAGVNVWVSIVFSMCFLVDLSTRVPSFYPHACDARCLSRPECWGTRRMRYAGRMYEVCVFLLISQPMSPYFAPMRAMLVVSAGRSVGGHDECDTRDGCMKRFWLRRFVTRF